MILCGDKEDVGGGSVREGGNFPPQRTLDGRKRGWCGSIISM